MTTVYGGDEVNALVVDVGSCLCKAGYAGDDTPKAVFPSDVGITPPGSSGASAMDVDGASGSRPSDRNGGASTSKRTLHVGQAAVNYRRDNMEVSSLFSADGQYEDWELLESLFSHTFTERLRANPAEFAMMLAEPSHNTDKCREKLTELLFEKFSVPALFLGRNAVLSSFATARQTSLVVDVGHQATTVSAVHDGYVLLKSIVRSPLAGQLLTHVTARAMEARGAVLRPRYAFRKTLLPSGAYEVSDVEVAHTTDSFRRYQVSHLAADIKETLCALSPSHFDADENAGMDTVSYELPDGHEITVGPERHSIPEAFFQPDLVRGFLGSEAYPGLDGGLQSLPELIMECINKSDVDVRKELYNGIVLTGGSSLFNGLRERLEKELQALGPQGGNAKLKLIAPANNIERRYSVWIGGSILASLGSFQQMWMSRKDFEEHGAALIHRRSA